MRKLKLVSLLLLLLIGVGQVWADPAPVNTIMWSENWTGATTGTSGSDNVTPSANYGHGTTVYNSGTITYTQSANSVYVRNENTGGGTAPELLLSSGKTWTISNIPTGGATELSLTYVSNNTKSSVSCSTEGASISGSSKSYTITTGGAETITLVFSCSGNTRIDNVELKVKTAGSSGQQQPTLSSISVETAPMKTTYTAGETFDPTGLVITRTYSNSQSDTYTYANHTNEFSFNPDLDTELATSNTSVTITYGGKTTTQNITVNASTPSSDGGVSDLTFTSACGGSGTADDGADWTVTSDGTESTYDGTKGIHYGTNGAAVQYIKLTTNDISGTITKVVVNASAASGVSATVSVTVGGSSFGGNPQSISTTATGYIFTGSASGEIIVTVTKPSSATKAIYCKSVVVTYTSGGGSQQTGSSFNPY